MYITDSLKSISEGIVRIAGGHAMGKRYIDVLNSIKEKASNPDGADEKTADEIISNIKNKLGAIGQKQEKTNGLPETRRLSHA